MELSRESAEKELERFFEYYEIDSEELGEAGNQALDMVKPVIIKGIMKGLISFEDKDEKGFCIIQKLKNGTEFVYQEMNGEAKVAMSSKKEDDGSGRIFALLGSLSKQGGAVITKFKGPDLKRAEHLATLLLLA